MASSESPETKKRRTRSRPSEYPAIRTNDYIPREWLTRDEVSFHVEQVIRIDRERSIEPRLEKLEKGQKDHTIRMEDGFNSIKDILNKINQQQALADQERKLQHEQGQKDNRQMLKRLDGLEGATVDIRQKSANLTFLLRCAEAFMTVKRLGSLVRKPAFWVIISVLTAGSACGSAILQLWERLNPENRVSVLPVPMPLPSPVTPSMSLPAIPAVPKQQLPPVNLPSTNPVTGK